MANRLSENTRIWCRRYLTIRDGNKCSICGKISRFNLDSFGINPTTRFENPTTQIEGMFERPTTQNRANVSSGEDLDIDHIDGNKRNWNPLNLRLLCQHCNRGIENHRRADKSYSANLRERENINLATKLRQFGNPTTQIVQSVIDYSSGSVEMQASALFTKSITDYCLKEVREKGFCFKNDLIYSAAEVAGCSIQTARNHILKMTSSKGVFKESKDMLGGLIITWKDNLQPDDSTKQKVGLKLE